MGVAWDRGRAAEDLAAAYFQMLGAEIVARNVPLGRGGGGPDRAGRPNARARRGALSHEPRTSEAPPPPSTRAKCAACAARPADRCDSTPGSRASTSSRWRSTPRACASSICAAPSPTERHGPRPPIRQAAHPRGAHAALARASARAAAVVARALARDVGDRSVVPRGRRRDGRGRHAGARSRRGGRTAHRDPPRHRRQRPQARRSGARRRDQRAASRRDGARGRHAGVRVAVLSRRVRGVVQRHGGARAASMGRALPLVGAGAGQPRARHGATGARPAQPAPARARVRT